MAEEYVTREEFEQKLRELHAFFSQQLRELEATQAKEIARMKTRLDALTRRIEELEKQAALAHPTASIYLQ